MNERELQQAVIELARLLGFCVAHFRPAQTGKGWRTAVEGDGAGFPDLVLAGRGRVLFVELKTDVAKLRPEQRTWFDTLVAGGAEVFVWRPSEWRSGAIERELRGR